MTETQQPRAPEARPGSIHVAGVEVRCELVEWLQWMVGGCTADVLSEALYLHLPFVALTTRDEEAILVAIERAAEPPDGLGELECVLRGKRRTRL
jgi:hypothetical protein